LVIISNEELGSATIPVAGETRFSPGERTNPPSQRKIWLRGEKTKPDLSATEFNKEKELGNTERLASEYG